MSLPSCQNARNATPPLTSMSAGEETCCPPPPPSQLAGQRASMPSPTPTPQEQRTHLPGVLLNAQTLSSSPQLSLDIWLQFIKNDSGRFTQNGISFKATGEPREPAGRPENRAATTTATTC